MRYADLMPPVPDTVRPKRGPMTVFTVRLPQDLRDWITQCSEERGCDETYFVRYILDTLKAESTPAPQ